ncbi:MAG: TetR/AcrR family transcriptional regulator [Firmicutes bacterium]|nr:TetR/AcrR family transcriptional regulator [Bacillota bacterium]
MVGLRQFKKKRTRKKILEVSKELFLDKGYDKTTSKEIAKRCELGVGTVYNYFESKADIFLAIMSEEFGIEEKYNLDEIDIDNNTVSDIISEFILSYIEKISYINKNLIREIIFVAIKSFKTKFKLFNKLMQMDYKLMDKIHELLLLLKDKNLIKKDFNTKEAVEVIYGSIIYEMCLYAYTEDISLNETKENIRKKIRFIFREN